MGHFPSLPRPWDPDDQSRCADLVWQALLSSAPQNCPSVPLQTWHITDLDLRDPQNHLMREARPGSYPHFSDGQVEAL